MEIVHQRRKMKKAISNNGWLFWMIVVLMMFGCYPAQRLADQNLSSVYQISDQTPLPSYMLYQFHSDSLRLFFSIPPRRVIQEEKNPDGNDYTLFVSIFPRDNRFAIIDSATYHYSRDPIYPGEELRGSIDLFTGPPSGRVLSVLLSNLENVGANEQLFPLIEAFPPGRYHYQLSDDQSIPMTSPFLKPETRFSIRSSIINDQSIQVRYYEDKYPIAMPPFATVPFHYFDYAADSVFTIAFQEGVTPILQFTRPGIYHLTADPNMPTGFTLFVRTHSYPWISHPEQMIHPLRYLTSNREYEALAEAPDPKEAVDRFWINNAGNELRAKKLIREYYRRVEKANYLFTSHQEGWKTDRGMIYIMYGPPSVVQRGPSSEIWTYGESRNLMSLTFIFTRLSNPFTDSDYMLERSPNYKTGWYQMVNSWRR
jgi:GWxTD domain-containing protein